MNEEVKNITKMFAKVLEKVPNLRYIGDPVLRISAKKVDIQEGIKIAEELKRVLLGYRRATSWGRGIAAPQIGEDKSVFVTYLDDSFEVFLNPKIVESSEATNFYRELCMSTGVIASDVERPDWIVLEWMDCGGKNHKERFDGFKARLYQHEVAHLSGKIMLDEAVEGSVEFITFDPLKENLRTNRDII